jgi:hypothetical protein
VTPRTKGVGIETYSDQQLFEVVVRVRRRTRGDVYTVYLRDEDGNRIDSSSGLDPATAREISDAFLDRLGVCPE